MQRLVEEFEQLRLYALNHSCYVFVVDADRGVCRAICELRHHDAHVLSEGCLFDWERVDKRLPL